MRYIVTWKADRERSANIAVREDGSTLHDTFEEALETVRRIGSTQIDLVSTSLTFAIGKKS